jgi:hypothetical protein
MFEKKGQNGVFYSFIVAIWLLLTKIRLNMVIFGKTNIKEQSARCFSSKLQAVRIKII